MKIIADIGSNWRTLSDIKLSIVKAKECGSDVAKFQMYTALELYGSEAYGEHMHQHYLHAEWIPEIAATCEDVNIEFMCTAFSPQGYETVNPFVKEHKIASAEITDTGILEKVNSFCKPVYLSTGGASYDDIRHALLHLKSCAVTIMFCVADYPAKIVDFRHLEILKEKFGAGYQYGYSDHSTDVLNIPKLAQHHGCKVIEKHANFSPHTHTPDAGHSLNVDEFKLMARKIHGDEISPVETDRLTSQDMKAWHKRRFVATKAIEPGDHLVVGENVGIYRPKTRRLAKDEVSTFRPWDIRDKVAAQALQFGMPIVFGDLEK